MGIKVVLDTEIGDNIDEAFALALACTSPEIELLGVTTTYHEAEVRALIARRLLGAYGRLDVPVAAGVHLRYSGQQWDGSRLTQRRLAYSTGPLAPAANADAVQFIAKILECHSQVTLIGNAPLTNFAAVLRQYPQLTERIARIIFMGGWSSQAVPEYNMREDPEAAATVLNSGVPLTAVGYESTLPCMMRQPYILCLESALAPGPQFLCSLYRAWYESEESTPIMHDALPVALLVRPDLTQLTSRRVSINTSSGPSSGVVYTDTADGLPISITTRVDTESFMQFLIQRVTQGYAWSALTQLDPAKVQVALEGAYVIPHFPGWSLRVDCSEQQVLGLIDHGTGKAHINGEDIDLETGSLLYIPHGAAYQLETTEGMEGHWLHFNMTVLQADSNHRTETIDRIPGLPCLLPVGLITSELRSTVQQVVEHWLHPWPEGSLLCQAGLLQIIAKLLALHHEQGITRATGITAALLQAKRYIESHASEPLDLGQISSHVGLSKFYLVRSFREAFGSTPLKYHTALRMAQARSLLRLHHLTVKQVAAQLGYSSTSAFSRAFSREVGLPPSKYNGT